jgi:hypothetical protein
MALQSTGRRRRVDVLPAGMLANLFPGVFPVRVEGLPELSLALLLTPAFGFVQWFVVVPRLWAKVLKAHRKVPVTRMEVAGQKVASIVLLLGTWLLAQICAIALSITGVEEACDVALPLTFMAGPWLAGLAIREPRRTRGAPECAAVFRARPAILGRRSCRPVPVRKRPQHCAAASCLRSRPGPHRTRRRSLDPSARLHVGCNVRVSAPARRARDVNTSCDALQRAC